MEDLENDFYQALGATPPPQSSGPMVINVRGVGSKDNSSKYDDQFAQAGQQYGVDPAVLRGVARVETNFNPNAVSHDDNGKPLAHGLMQFTMPTAHALGVSDPYDPSQAIPAAAKLLRQNLDASNGDVTRALMMYHGGTNTSNWGPKTQAYPGKVLRDVPKPSAAPADPSAFDADSVLDAIRGNTTQTAQPGSTFQLPPASQPQLQMPGKTAQTPSTATVSVNPLGAGVGMAENALHMGSAFAGNILGGLAGVVTGNADNVQKVQNAVTYDPRTEAGKALQQNIAAGGQQVKNLAMSIPGVQAGIDNYTKEQDRVGAISPALGALIATVPTAIGTMAAPEVRGALESAAGAGKTALSLVGKTAPALDMASRVDPMIGPKPRVKLNVDGTTTPVQPPVAPQGVTPEMMRQPPIAPTLPPDLQSAIDNSGSRTNATALARHTEAGSLPVPVDLTAGQAMDNPHQMSLEKNDKGRFPEMGARLDAQNGQLIQNFDAIRGQVAPDITAHGSDLGQAHVDAYKAMDAPKQADITEKYKALEDANGGQFPLDGKSFVGNTEAALDKALKSGSVPADIQRSLDQFKNGRQMTFQDFETLRSDLADTMRTASDGRQRAAANIIRQQLESMPLTPEAQQLKPLADAARNAAKARFSAIDSDPAYKAAINDGVAAGEPSPLANDFIKNYVVKGKTANVQNMVQNLSNDPQNIQIIRAGVIDHLKDVSGIDLRTNLGNVSQSRLNSAIEQLHQDNKNGLILGDQGAQQINTLGNVARYTEAQTKGSFVNNSHSAVAAMAIGAKNLGLRIADRSTLGVSGFVQEGLEAAAAKRKMAKSLAPGAGIKLSDFPK